MIDEVVSTAYHEAGHAVVALSKGYSVPEIRVGLQGRVTGYCDLERPSDESDPEAELEIYLAGSLAATCITRARLEWHGDDGAGVEALASETSLDAALSRTAQILNEHWPAVHALASALLVAPDRRLNRAQILGLLNLEEAQ